MTIVLIEKFNSIKILFNFNDLSKNSLKQMQ